MIEEGSSTDELLKAVGKSLGVLTRCVKHNRGRETAWEELTTLMQAAEGLGQRLGLVDWRERPPAADEDAEEEGAREWRQEVSLADLMQRAADAESDHDEDDDIPLRQRVRELEAGRADLFRAMIRYTCAGCKSAEEVTRRWLALVRRVDPDALRGIGLSQADVARALGETRAATSAREKREFEARMKRSGARGYVGLGGARGQANHERCKAAQKGNRNRAKGHARKHAGSDGASARPFISGRPDINPNAPDL